MSEQKQKQAAVMRDAFQSVVDRFEPDSDRLVLFTTFNFVPRFFEANILPLVVGDAVTDLAGVSETRHAINEELKKTRCLVVCDRSTRPEPKGEMRYGLLSVGLPHGRFHPKIMLMAGKLKDTGASGLWLFVGSGNLSLSGWAINREIVGVTPVARQHARELEPLLAWILEQAEHQLGARVDMREEGDTRVLLEELLAHVRAEDRLHPGYAGMPSLHLALPFGQRDDLLAALTAGRQWSRATVVSPFWSDVDNLVDRLGVESCEFVPSLTRDGKYAFPVSSLAEQQECQYTFGKFGDDQYTHAKALLLQDTDGQKVLCIGSANFTSAALRRAVAPAVSNVEAVLRYELSPGANPWPPFASLDRAQLDDAAGMAEAEQPPPLPPIDASVYYDWLAGEFGGRLEVLDNRARMDVVLEVAGMSHTFAAQPGLSQALPAMPKRCIRPVRSFSVRWGPADGGTASYFGLVTQVNATPDQLQYKPRPRLDKILELLRSLNPEIGDEEMRARAARGRGEGGGDGEQDVEGASFDYFGLFHATWKLRDYYRRLAAGSHPAAPFDPVSPYSVTTLYRAITLQPAQTLEARIGRYIHLAEVAALVDEFGRAGVNPPEGSPCRDIGVEMTDLVKPIQEALGHSETFRGMFGGSDQRQVEAFLAWFHSEMKQEEQAHA
ncbi:hypothetical protein DNF23_33880 [Pseudomonas syringae pv. pisi]|jgi:hypothetical protein